MEFNCPEDATKAASQAEHVINHKKASVQFFKAKDPHPVQKRGHIPAEGIEKVEVRVSHFGSRFGLNSSSLIETMPQKGGFCSTKFDFGRQTSAFSPVYNEPNLVRDLSTCKKSIITQPKEAKVPARRRWFSDFYSSLGRAEEVRYYHATYIASNIRFNRQTYLH